MKILKTLSIALSLMIGIMFSTPALSQTCVRLIYSIVYIGDFRTVDYHGCSEYNYVTDTYGPLFYTDVEDLGACFNHPDTCEIPYNGYK